MKAATVSELWARRFEYAQLGREMLADTITSERETEYWRLRTLEQALEGSTEGTAGELGKLYVQALAIDTSKVQADEKYKACYALAHVMRKEQAQDMARLASSVYYTMCGMDSETAGKVADAVTYGVIQEQGAAVQGQALALLATLLKALVSTHDEQSELQEQCAALYGQAWDVEQERGMCGGLADKWRTMAGIAGTGVLERSTWEAVRGAVMLAMEDLQAWMDNSAT